MVQIKFSEFVNWKKYWKFICSVASLITVTLYFSGLHAWWWWLSILIGPIFGIAILLGLYSEYKIFRSKNMTLKEIRQFKLNKLNKNKIWKINL